MKPKVHLIRYISIQEIRLVLSRVPQHYRKRVRHIFLENKCRGVRQLGCVIKNSRRDIWIYPWLPPRVSLKRFLYRGQSAVEFGAPNVGQWTPWAVRRFLLYDVVLHELGHLQEIHPKKKDWRRRFAGESKAEEFADYWRRCLFAEDNFQHEDLVHFAPTEEELAFLDVWALLDKSQRYALTMLTLDVHDRHDPSALDFVDKLPDEYQSFLNKTLPLQSRSG